MYANDAQPCVFCFKLASLFFRKLRVAVVRLCSLWCRDVSFFLLFCCVLLLYGFIHIDVQIGKLNTIGERALNVYMYDSHLKKMTIVEKRIAQYKKSSVLCLYVHSQLTHNIGFINAIHVFMAENPNLKIYIHSCYEHTKTVLFHFHIFRSDHQ